MPSLNYFQFNGDVATEINYDAYKENEISLKDHFDAAIKPLSDQDLLLTFLAFKKKKYSEEVTRQQIGFYSHLEDLFQKEFLRRKLETVCCDANGSEDGRSEIEKRLIKRFKCIRSLDDLKLIERYIILMNRKIEDHHEKYSSLDSSYKALPQRNFFELQMEENFLLKELEIRGLSIPDLTLSHAATFIGL